jgi:hypothetical protein
MILQSVWEIIVGVIIITGLNIILYDTNSDLHQFPPDNEQYLPCLHKLQFEVHYRICYPKN